MKVLQSRPQTGLPEPLGRRRYSSVCEGVVFLRCVQLEAPRGRRWRSGCCGDKEHRGTTPGRGHRATRRSEPGSPLRPPPRPGCCSLCAGLWVFCPAARPGFGAAPGSEWLSSECKNRALRLLFYSLRMRLHLPLPPFSSLLAALPARRHALKSVLDRAVRCEPRAGEGATSELAACPARVNPGPEDAGGALWPALCTSGTAEGSGCSLPPRLSPRAGFPDPPPFQPPLWCGSARRALGCSSQKRQAGWGAESLLRDISAKELALRLLPLSPPLSPKPPTPQPFRERHPIPPLHLPRPPRAGLLQRAFSLPQLFSARAFWPSASPRKHVWRGGREALPKLWILRCVGIDLHPCPFQHRLPLLPP